jgi:tetratricopeptide (TPR) repeat protein
MDHTIRCPDCGRENPEGAEYCAQCNHPLGEARDHLPGGAGAGPAPAGPGRGGMPPIRRRIIRARRPGGRDAQQAAQLWLIFGTICVLVVLWVAIQSVNQRSTPQVEGSNADQQKLAAQLFSELARDSNNVDAHHQLADLLYDTANWPEAIVHYRAVLRRDSTRVNAIVDLGVCYFNLSDTEEAEKFFQRALTLEPQQPVALFNLGIVHESQGDTSGALQFYHRAMQSKLLSESMRKPLMDRMEALFRKSGRQAPPLPGGQ